MYRRRKVATVVNLVGLANVLVDLSADEESARRNVMINECSDSFSDYIRSATMLHMIQDTDLVDTAKVEGFIENSAKLQPGRLFKSFSYDKANTSGPLHTF